MGLPDVALYYRAMSLVRILNWCHDSAKKIWVSIEQIMAGRKLAGIPWIPSTDRGLSKWTSPLTKSTLLIWDKSIRRLCSSDIPSDPIGGVPMVSSRGGGGIFWSLGEGWGYDMWQICPSWNINPPARFDIENGEDTYGGVEIPSIGVLFQGSETRDETSEFSYCF